MLEASNLLERLKGIPPVRAGLIRRYDRYFSNAVDVHLFNGVYSSFAEAHNAAPVTKGVGYDQKEAANLYRNMMSTVRPADYPVLFWLSQILPQVDSLMDLGGHIGIKYYAFRKYLELGESFTWSVCDVPEVASTGRHLAAEKSEARLTFTSDFADISGSDVLLCSGSLQYLEPSLGQLLQQLESRPQHLIVNTTPFTADHDTYFTLNNIGSAFCPYKIINQPAFEAELSSLGFEVVDRWDCPGKGCHIPYRPEHSLKQYSGLYLRHTEEQTASPAS